MSLATFGEIIFCVALAGAVLWEGKDYELDHKPMAQAMWAWVEYDKCRDSVKEAQLKICTDLQIPAEQCPLDLSQCDKFKEKR